MALPVLDGNQSATTLSSVVTGGEHIVAHSVVSLGTTAISNITSAVSGSVVSVSNFPASQSTTFGAVTGSVSVLNFPATQTISGTVTVGNATTASAVAVRLVAEDTNPGGSPAGVNVNLYSNDNALLVDALKNGNSVLGYDGLSSYVQVKPVVGSSVTVGNTVTIAGTVTANPTGTQTVAGSISLNNAPAISAEFFDPNGNIPISGTVTVGNSVTIGSMPNGSLTTRFGTPTTASSVFATSAVTNASRKYLLIQNVTTQSNVITVGIGFTPTTTQGIQLTAGAGITFESSYIPTGAVYVLSSVTASNFTILEA